MTDTKRIPERRRSSARASRAAFRGLLLRDLTSLDKQMGAFLPGVIMQPLLFVFVLTYLFPTIGQSVGGGGPAAAARFATLVMAGAVGQVVMLQGIFRVAVPLARELEVTHEIDDQVMAPAPLSLIAGEKVLFGAILTLFSAMIVFPVAAFVPASPVYLRVNWPVLATLAPLAAVTAGAFGLAFATLFRPRSVFVLSGAIALPIGFGGATLYTWSSLDPIPWLKYGLLVNPLVYMTEGFRAALTTGVPHMPLPIVYGALLAFCSLFLWAGVRGFKKRVLL